MEGATKLALNRPLWRLLVESGATLKWCKPNNADDGDGGCGGCDYGIKVKRLKVDIYLPPLT